MHLPNHDESPATVFRLGASYVPTPLVELPRLARECRVAAVLLKDEGQRPLGSFKSLGGMYAGLKALARGAGLPGIAALVARKSSNRSLPTLICASDGNHGLAVAAAAELAGARARIFLHRHVPESRARRIANCGADIIWVDGTYDDAVDAASRAARDDGGLLIADTSAQPGDPVVADVMTGYELIVQEIVDQLRSVGGAMPSHLFVQAGVGGLAAALAKGLCETYALGCRIVVVEPERVACVGAALRSGRIERLPGDLQTAAEMLSCGEASAPAVEILRRVKADAVVVAEHELIEAVNRLAACGGPNTTPSGATGLAGLLTALPGTPRGQELALDSTSRVLLIATEGCVPCE